MNRFIKINLFIMLSNYANTINEAIILEKFHSKCIYIALATANFPLPF